MTQEILGVVPAEAGVAGDKHMAEAGADTEESVDAL